jgi:hypothetical protein
MLQRSKSPIGPTLAKQRSRIGFLCYLIAASGMAISANAAADNASNPLAAVDNTDLRWQHLDLESGSRDEYFIDGAKMLNPKLKLKYELRYWNTDVTGTDESD